MDPRAGIAQRILFAYAAAYTIVFVLGTIEGRSDAAGYRECPETTVPPDRDAAGSS